MAGRIKGITIEIDGNTTQLQKSLKDVDQSLRDTQKSLKDVDKLLKLDPSNTELLRQKQDLLAKAINDTKSRLDKLKEAQRQMDANGIDKNSEQYQALQREIIACEQALEGYQKQVNALNPSIQSFGVKMGELSEKTRGMSTAAAGLGTAMLGMAYKAGTTADDLLTLSRNTGISIEELQKMQYASNLVDVSMDQMTGSLTKMVKQMASGNDAFATLGVSITDADGNMRDATDVWYESLAALSQVENGTLRDQLAMELFGKSAMELSGIVDDGGAALAEYGQEAEDMGLILSEDSVSAAGEFNDALDKLKATAQQSFFEAGAALAESLLPMLETLVQKVSEVLTWFASLDGNTQMLILTIVGLVAAISPVAGLISGIVTIGGALAAVTAPMAATFMGIVAAVGAVIAIGTVLYQNWDSIKQAGIDLWNSVVTTWEGIKTTISDAIGGAKQAVSDAIEAIKGLFNFQITWPHIPLPHFSVSGSANPLDWLKDGIPKISVDWYAKAQNQPYYFNQPSIIGVGDVPEVVIGADAFRRMTAGNTITVAPVVNVYGNVQDYDALARKVSDRINSDIVRKMRVY